MSNRDYSAYYMRLVDRIERAMEVYLPKPDAFPEELAEAMRYSVFAGGKRLRPVLLLATVEAFGKDSTPLLPAACALEFLHTYSLIHDDLPAMDNDDYRRGKLTNHKKFGEATAILAGDGLLTLSFHTLAASAVQADLVVRMVQELADASGVHGMVAGQVADMYYEKRPVTPEALEFIHLHKTAALIVAPLRMGAIASGASEGALTSLSEFGRSLGLAFQIMDDLLDVFGDEQQLGKRPGVDAKLGKATYPALYGVEESRNWLERHSQKAFAVLRETPELEHPEYLEAIVHFLSHRDH
ncbi:polyprenyl synthetase family protein [Sulfoacidibacillus thermotolerans]|uniref:Farnesyl diphosphate synthase n=1 Tax=Sulfoacidibacillus thermotolerans TaxID=1765684 RepID=A0A2U3DBX4_SULT2|nr:farnesyl diphosphate synthase [Sulfoacidibacillus thermotolerans]PWI58780.1 hypothetical protein BM613_01415 [Sulfoacidibacillus thermotolerans]